MALNAKLEEAWAAVLTPPATAAVANVSVKTGMNSGTKTIPEVICQAEEGDAEEDPKGSGNFWVGGALQVRHTAVPDEDSQTPAPPDPKIEAKALIDAAFGAARQDNIADLLTAAVANFTVFPTGVVFGAPRRFQDEEGAWVDELPYKAYCCEADFAN